METRFIVTFKTSKMKKVVPEEYVGNSKKCPKEQEMQEDVETALHKFFPTLLNNILENEDWVFDEMNNSEHDDVLSVEGFEHLSDYGNIKVTVKKFTPKGEDDD